MLKKKYIILILSAILIINTGCSIKFNSNEQEAVVNDAGVFVTDTKGNSWVQRVLIPTTSGAPQSIGGLSVNFFVMDPSDNNAIYLGANGNGLIYTYDGARNWQVATSLGQRNINSLAIDPNSKCTIYATILNEVYQSIDCSRTWERIYLDNNKSVQITAVVVDHYNGNNLYIGTSAGDIVKSFDQGENWQTVKRFGRNIIQMMMSPNDSRIIFTILDNGIHRSKNSAVSWVNLNENLKEFKGGANYRDMIFIDTEPGLMYLASNYGLLKTLDYGDTWTGISLITPEAGALINSLAGNPKNLMEIYYVTNTTFYRSLDGGNTWSTKKLPTTGIGWKLLIDPENPNIIYVGVRK